MVVQLLGIAARVGGAALARHGAASALRALDDGNIKVPKISMSFVVSSNIREVSQYLNDVQLKRLPFAISKALNDTAYQARAELMKQAPRKMDKPTPFTVRGFRVKQSHYKRDLDAVVYIAGTPGYYAESGRDGGIADRTKYMTFMIDGGTRLPKGKAIPVPVNVKINKYGNMGSRTVQSLLKRKDTFSGVPRGARWTQAHAGIWQRGEYKDGKGWASMRGKKKASSIKMLVAWEPRTQYNRQFPFDAIVNNVVRKRFTGNFRLSLTKALWKDLQGAGGGAKWLSIR
jgi:hypothetical protein